MGRKAHWQDPLYEVVLTIHGYTLMAWEPERDEWYQAELRETPEILLKALLDVYAGFPEDQIAENGRELNPSEETKIKTMI